MNPCGLDLHTLARLLQSRQLSCRELMAATLQRVQRLNPRLNAIVNLADEQTLLRQADERDAELANGGRPRGLLHGVPVAIKDMAHAVGFPTTEGSPLLARRMPVADSVFVARMKAAGCIVIGKS